MNSWFSFYWGYLRPCTQFILSQSAVICEEDVHSSLKVMKNWDIDTWSKKKINTNHILLRYFSFIQ